MSTDIPTQIHTELRQLAPDAQQRVLDYLRSLKGLGPGTTFENLEKHLGSIDPAEGITMQDAIRSGCEQVNLDEW